MLASGADMPLVTAFNLSKEDRLPEMELALREALVSMPELQINDWEVDLVPVFRADGFSGAVTRINVDLWEKGERTKDALQELATRIAHHNTGKALPDGEGYTVMKRVAADENLHYLFYRDLVSAALEVDPSGMVEAIKRQTLKFEMPGAGIADDKKVMGKYANGKAARILGWGTTALMTVAAVILFAFAGGGGLY